MLSKRKEGDLPMSSCGEEEAVNNVNITQIVNSEIVNKMDVNKKV